jgi:hypothetical protein
MKKSALVCALTALFLAAAFLQARSQTVGAPPVEGKVTQEGKPLSDAQVVFTNADTGRVYKSKTDKNGTFVLVGVPSGNFQIDVLGEKGEKIFSQVTAIGMQGNTTSSNILKIDIANSQPITADNKFGVPEAPAPKLTKEQIAKIKADNEKIAGMNSLITEAQNARQAQDWPKAENALKQLLAAAPDTTRWDFYYFLGDAQSRSNKLPEAAQSYEKGIEVAKGVIAGTSPADSKIPTLNPAAAKAGTVRMLTSQGNIYLKLQKQDEAIASLKKAAALDPSPLNEYNLCGVEFNAQKYDEAKAPCNKYLELEPTGAHVEEVKAFLTQMGQK